MTLLKEKLRGELMSQGELYIKEFTWRYPKTQEKLKLVFMS